MEDSRFTQLLLDWFDGSGRDLPWRFKGGAHPDPYVVLVSEIMLQQTTVKTVLSYFDRFMQCFPTVQALANAPLEDVYRAWQGLGYYTRARNLHRSAQIIVGEMNGCFPQTLEALKKLKGIGTYTQASFLALAFNRPETVVDGNVIRIMTRLFHRTEPVNELTAWIDETARRFTSVLRPADYASAIMDLGATVCTPKNPQCTYCPWQEACLSKDRADLEKIPQRRLTAKKDMHSNVYVIVNARGDVFLRRQTEKGLLSGLYEFPWREAYDVAGAEDTKKTVTHIFTHIRLTLNVYVCHAEVAPTVGEFVSLTHFDRYPLSTLMKKVLKAAREFL